MKPPKIVETTLEEIAYAIKRITEAPLEVEVRDLANHGLQWIRSIPYYLQQKSITIARLRTLVFGEGYEPKNKSAPKAKKPHEGAPAKNDEATSPRIEEENSAAVSEGVVAEVIETPEVKKDKKPGHGRMPHTVYKNCDEVNLSLVGLAVGTACPLACGGYLGPYDAGVIIRIKGQNIAQVTRYWVEKLRCSLCNEVLSAAFPPEAGPKKYDGSFKSMLALMKYYVAVPFYRQEYFQKTLGFPLSDSTQWDLIEQLSGYCYAPFNELKRLAAQGRVIHNDDTRLKILEVIARIKAGDAERKGMYTTGIISLYQSHKIALFLNGTQHAGENLEGLLKKRAENLPAMIQMCDGLLANIPKTLETILCNCLSHGFRKFKELEDYFPEECVVILQALGEIFKQDEKTRLMTGEERLKHHQEHSGPVMQQLELYMASLLNEKIIEPNSELGKAIKYMQKRWMPMTRFLTVVGAPIDNNVVERALKIAIRNRKNAMFYRTIYSAGIGGMITSLIYTCDLADENPFDYLNALQRYREEVTRSPGLWLPWNYRERLGEVPLAEAA